MNPRRFFLVSALAALIFAPSAPQPLAAQDQQGYSLERCIETGMKNNIETLRARNDVRRSATYKTEAYGQFLPSVRGNATWSRSDEEQLAFRADNFLRSRNSYSYNMQAGLTIFDGMRNFNTVDQSLLQHEAAEAGFAHMRSYIVFSIQQAFYNALRAAQLTRVAESNLERSKGQLERIREMNVVGSVPQADVYRQQVVVGNDELALIEANNNAQNALVDLQALIGLTPVADFKLRSDGVEDAVALEDVASFRAGLGEFAPLVREAEQRRSDFRQAELGVRSADKAVSVAQAGHWPTLTAFAQYNWNNLELADFMLYDRFIYGMQLSVPVFSNFQVSSTVERSELQRLDNELMLEQLRRSIATEVMKALNALEAAEKNVDISAKKLQSAREDQRIASERYDLGAGTLLDLTTANANLTMAESDVVNATFNYRTARKHIEYQLGRNQN
ncbi:MAG: TolC family protein [Bacteroidetes bacterium]|nr:TolC family protein [Bacteroidota bacterium]